MCVDYYVARLKKTYNTIIAVANIAAKLNRQPQSHVTTWTGSNNGNQCGHGKVIQKIYN